MTGSEPGLRTVRWAVLAALSAMLLALLVVVAPASADSSSEYHETARFGGFDKSAFRFGQYGPALTPGEFLEATGFAVDPVDNGVYVADRTSSVEGLAPNENPPLASWRIQKLGPTGEVLGTTTFLLPAGLERSSSIAGLAVDHRAGRLYALVMGPVRAALLTEKTGNATAAQEVLAWSTTPAPCAPACGRTGGALVAAPGEGITSDPLGSTGGLISGEAKLEASAATALYDPQGIAIDRLEVAGVNNPVAIEASDLALSEPGNTKLDKEGIKYSEFETNGNTIVRQVATQPRGFFPTGTLGASWSGASLKGELGASWGPRGIFDNADGSLSVLLHSSEVTATNAYIVRVSADLTKQRALNRDAGETNQPSQATMHLDRGPFFTDPLPRADLPPPSELPNAGPEAAQLSNEPAHPSNGLYAAGFYVEPSVCGGEAGFWHTEERPDGVCVAGQKKGANIGVRLLRPLSSGVISEAGRGASIVNTLGGELSPCHIGAQGAALAAGAGGTLWVLDRGPTSKELVEFPQAQAGRQVIELAPGAGTERERCPQPAGTFAMGLACGGSQSASLPLTVPEGVPAAFDASSVNLHHATAFGYEWEFERQGTGKAESVVEEGATAINHTFAQEGSYAVRLKVSSDFGVYTAPASVVNVISSAGLLAPRPQFTVTGGALQATADGSSSSPGTCNTIAYYVWNWGDSSPPEVDGPETPQVTHAYALPGPYPVTLTVVNSKYQSVESAAQTVTVAPAEQALIAAEPGPPALVAPSTTGPAPTQHSRGPTNVAPHGSFSHGTLSVRVSCQAGRGSCAGTVQVRSVAAFPASAARPAGRSARRRTSRLVLGQASFSLPEGASKAVTVRLTTRAEGLLSRLKRLSVQVIVSAHDSFGDPGSATLGMTLLLPNRRAGGAPQRGSH